MELLVVRHARAQDRDRFAATGQIDAERPLTRKGIRRMKDAARGLRLLVPSIDLLASSRLRRSIETAQIIADTYGGISPIQRDELDPGADVAHLIDWLAGQKQKRTTCIVGHEPDLSALLTALLPNKSERPPKLKKGSVSLVRFERLVAASSGGLQWYHSASELASITRQAG